MAKITKWQQEGIIIDGVKKYADLTINFSVKSERFEIILPQWLKELGHTDLSCESWASLRATWNTFKEQVETEYVEREEELIAIKVSEGSSWNRPGWSFDIYAVVRKHFPSGSTLLCYSELNGGDRPGVKQSYAGSSFREGSGYRLIAWNEEHWAYLKHITDIKDGIKKAVAVALDVDHLADTLEKQPEIYSIDEAYQGEPDFEPKHSD
jgi:hypothetical protein